MGRAGAQMLSPDGTNGMTFEGPSFARVARFCTVAGLGTAFDSRLLGRDSRYQKGSATDLPQLSRLSRCCLGFFYILIVVVSS